VTFQDLWQANFGEKGERVVVRELKAQKFRVTRTSFARDPEAPGGAKLDGCGKPIVIPDILAAKGGCSQWIEVKTKTRDVKYKGEVRQGIEEKYLRHYTEAERVTGIKGWLAFLVLTTHRGTGHALIRMADLEKLNQYAKPGEPGHERFFQGKPMVFWRTDIFDSFWIEQDELKPVPHATREWPTTPKRTSTLTQGHFNFTSGSQSVYGDRVGVNDAMRQLWKDEGKWKGEI